MSRYLEKTKKAPPRADVKRMSLINQRVLGIVEDSVIKDVPNPALMLDKTNIAVIHAINSGAFSRKVLTRLY